MRHFSLFDDMGDEPIKKTADDGANRYHTIKTDLSGISGLFDIITWAERMGITDPYEYASIIDHLNDTYASGNGEEGEYEIRLNGNEFMQLRNLYYEFQDFAENEGAAEMFEEGGDFADLLAQDIFNAENALMTSTPEESSGQGLEDIPTMNEFGEVPELSEAPEYNAEGLNPVIKPPSSGIPPSTAVGKALAAGLCPSCGQQTDRDESDPNLIVCFNCGFETPAPPNLRTDAQEINQLEQQFNLPDAEHPLGPDEGSNPRIGATGEEYYGRFVSLTGWSRPVWAVHVELEEGQMPPQSGDMVTVTINQGGISKVILTDQVADRNNVWNFKQYNAAPEPVAAPESQGGREIYTSGGFVKGADGKWLVNIRAAGGQRPPEPGDWAQIIQRSTGNRPVPLTLVEDMGGAWSFKNGHHPSI